MIAAAQSQRRSIDEIFAIYKIQKLKLDAHGSGYTMCPHCSLRRKPANRSKPVLHITVNRDSVLGFCNHCSWGFGEFFEPREGRAVFLATYDYRDEAGTVLFQTVRLHPKDFRQRRPDGRGGWIWDLKGVRRVLYRLPELIEAIKSGRKVVFIVEGEKDVDRLRALNEVATCNPMGAGKWRDEFAEFLRGFDWAIVIADKDEAGRAHVQQVAASVSQVVPHVRVIEMPGDGIKDVSDFLAADGTIDEIVAIAKAASDWASRAPGVGATPNNKSSKEPPRPLMREMPPADPFPVEALGDVLGAAAQAIQDHIQAPTAICGQSVLATAALATQGLVNVELASHQVHPVSLYFLTIGVSGERKTSVDSESNRPVRRYESELHEKYGGELQSYENDRTAWDAARKEAIKKNKKDRAAIKAALDQIGPSPTPPLVPLLICSEPTIEGLVKLYLAGRPSLGIFRMRVASSLAATG